ncbi:MAG: hypothetical protein IJZ34_10535 [Lachnospiraceae bacterium]|nr:hypothetical protein [Lachnospiraceae bacterium]
MLSAHIDEKLKMFSDEKYKLAGKDTTVQIKEKNESGRVVLQCSVENDTLIFDTPEKNTLTYLDGEKRGAKACADAFIFTQTESTDICKLHIIEFKKSINTSTLDKTKWQLIMGFYNARALAGFLGISIKETCFYSGYRIDEITEEKQASLIQLRASNCEEAIHKMKDWKEGKCRLKIDGEERCYPHEKIKLDENGYGELYLK